MYVKGNPVLSKMYAHSGLTLSENGLHFYLKNNPLLFFLITDDHVKIAEIMGFKYEEFDAAKEYIEFFELLRTNQFFRPSRYTVDTTDGKVRMFKELAEYLKEYPTYKGYTTRQLPDMFEPLKEFNFEARYNRLLELEQNASLIHKKFNGGSVLRLKPDFNRHNLQSGFVKFNSSFETHFDRLEFLYSHTEEEIVNQFIKINEL